MQVGFICPDGGLIEHEKCLKCCRMNERCACITTLYGMSEVREWQGKPSVTMLLKGLREAYLMIKQDFYMSPQQLMYSMHGRMVHSWKEHYGRKLGYIVEKAHPEKDITGILDLLIPTGNENEYDLVDYKTWGSYTMQKVLGYYKETVETGGVYKSGKRKGEPRTKQVWMQDDAMIDWCHADKQLNKYRMYCEDAWMKIRRLMVEVNVRDGGLAASAKRGVERNIYYLEVPRLSDDAVNTFFNERKEKLLDALEKNEVPEVCSYEERWEDNKCRKACAVWEYCDHGREIRSGFGEEEEDE
ncbi:MAG: hypothetical protein EOM12_03500 [Verrucomicrobiae bacterium]|nr:hypothetical protein [Verrucomicrobiae bacterium]